MFTNELNEHWRFYERTNDFWWRHLFVTNDRAFVANTVFSSFAYIGLILLHSHHHFCSGIDFFCGWFLLCLVYVIRWKAIETMATLSDQTHNIHKIVSHDNFMFKKYLFIDTAKIVGINESVAPSFTLPICWMNEWIVWRSFWAEGEKKRTPSLELGKKWWPIAFNGVIFSKKYSLSTHIFASYMNRNDDIEQWHWQMPTTTSTERWSTYILGRTVERLPNELANSIYFPYFMQL